MRVDTTGLNRVDVLQALYEAALFKVLNLSKAAPVIHKFLVEEELRKAEKNKFMINMANFGPNLLILNVSLEDPNSFDAESYNAYYGAGTAQQAISFLKRRLGLKDSVSSEESSPFTQFSRRETQFSSLSATTRSTTATSQTGDFSFDLCLGGYESEPDLVKQQPKSEERHMLKAQARSEERPALKAPATPFTRMYMKPTGQ